MSTSEGDPNRRLLPAWRSLIDNSAIRETASLNAPKPHEFDERFLQEKLIEWENIKASADSVNLKAMAIGIAADIVSTALATNKIDAGTEPADFLLKSTTTATLHTKSIAKRLKGSFETNDSTTVTSSVEQLIDIQQDAKQRVRLLRKQSHESPRNAFLWTDLSLAYITLGHKEQAFKAMQNALSLLPNHRAVLRVASRMFVHIGEIDRAHALLRTNEQTIYDPWLIAAEISTAQLAGRNSKLITKAQQMIKSERYALRHLSELAGALATQNLFSGNLKYARQLFRTSLVDPTDSAIAQVGWAARRDSAIRIPKDTLATRNAAEGKTWHAMLEGKWREAVSHSLDWALSEPFSARPVIHASFVLVTLLSDFKTGEDILRFGLQANSGDQTLLNNLVVALAYQGELAKAQVVFGKIKAPFQNDYPAAVWEATHGMLLYRGGKIDEGRQLYEKAISEAKRDVKIMALLHMAREEIHARTDRAAQALERAKRAAEESQEKLHAALQSKIEQEAKQQKISSLELSDKR